MSTRTQRPKLKEELFEVKREHSTHEQSTVCNITHEKVVLHRLEGFRNDLGADGQESVDHEGEVELPQIKEEEPEFYQQQMGDEQLPIKKEEDHFTWSPGESVKRDDLGMASEGAESGNAAAWPQIKEEEPEFPQQQHKREEPSPINKEEQNVTGSTGEPFKDYLNLHTRTHSGFRNDLGADGQESVDLEGEVELPQIKEEEPEFPQQQMGDEQLPIKREEDHFTWSLSEFVKREDVLGVSSGGAEPANTRTWPLIKEEEPEFSQQCKREDQPPIKNEECVKWSTGEPFKSEDVLGVASAGAEPANTTSWPLIKEEEPEFPQQQMGEEQLPIKKEEQNVTGSTGEPFKREDNLGGANREAQTELQFSRRNASRQCYRSSTRW
ncbi:uncharacterized protein LOC144065601 isoform X2 [Stigmatopora argus]